MALLDDVLTYLTGLSLVDGGTGWTGAKGYMPPTPDKVVAIFETPGLPPEMTKSGSAETAYDEPGFQIQVRGGRNEYSSVRSKIGELYSALHGAVPSGYLLVRAVQSGPFSLGLDSSDRPSLTWNFLATKER